MYLHSLELQLPLLFVQRTLQPEGAAGESGLSHKITGGNTTGVCELCEEGERNVHRKQCDMKKRKYGDLTRVDSQRIALFKVGQYAASDMLGMSLCMSITRICYIYLLKAYRGSSDRG